MPRPPSTDPKSRRVAVGEVRLTETQHALLQRLADEDGRAKGAELGALGRERLQELLDEQKAGRK